MKQSDIKLKRSEELAVGDVVTDVIGCRDGARLINLEPYVGNLGSYMVGIGTFVPGGRVSLAKGTTWTVIS